MSGIVHALTGKDGKLITEMRLSDGYVNATKLVQAAGKKMNHWSSIKKTKEYLDAFAGQAGVAASSLVQQQHGKGADQATWVHPEVAVDIAAWCSVAFKIQVNRLVTRYLSGQITATESAEASKKAAEEIDVVDDMPAASHQLLRWNELTKAKSDTLKEVTDGKAHSAYWRTDDAINMGATGKTTKELRVTLQIKKGTPRDRMGAAMLGMIAFQEGMIDKALREAKQDKGDFLKDSEAIGVAETITNEALQFCKKTGGVDLPMLQYKAPGDLCDD